MRKNVGRLAAAAGGSFIAQMRPVETETSVLLTERELERIREGVRARVSGPAALGWIERLLQDRDERIRRDRALAVQLLADAGPRAQPSAGSREREADIAVRFQEA